MTALIDESNGTIALGNAGVLGAGLSCDEIAALGIPVVRSYHTGAGWRMFSLQPVVFEGHAIYYTLTLDQDWLVGVSFTFIEDPDLQPKKAQEVYRQHLLRHLGAPHTISHDGLTVNYSYLWGQVTATYDSRNDSSAIHVAWSAQKRMVAS